MRRIFMMSCLIAGLAAGAAHGGGLKVGAQVGGLTIQDAENNQILVGGHVEMQLASFLGIRGDVAYRSEEEFTYQSQSLGDLTFTATTIPVTVSANVYLPLMVLKPYVTGGVGWYIHDYTFSQDLKDLGEEDGRETDVGWHVGAGATWSLAPKVDLFGEYRALFFGDDKSFDMVQDKVKDLSFTSHQITVGVSLILGGA